MYVLLERRVAQRADSLTVQPSSERFAEPLRDKKPSCEVDFLIKATRSVADLFLAIGTKFSRVRPHN